MVRALDRKLLRDLRRIWAQALAIALVLGCGIMVLVGAQATLRTLEETLAAYYDRSRFAEVFTVLKRAPRSVLEDVALIDGVAQVEGRTSTLALVQVEGMAVPATGQVVSYADEGAVLNLPVLRRGRMPLPERLDEVALSEPFAEAHGLMPGSRLRVILGGQQRELAVTGWVLSPEFIYALGPGALMPDDRRFGILFMPERAVAAAMDMSGAVNQISLRLMREADEREVAAQLDRLLAPYGGTGAHDRSRQLSHAFLTSEMHQLSAMSTYAPPVFLLVSAFLVNMVLGRLISLERSQIGLLKAVGYSTREIAWHYLKLALLIGVIGIAAGWAAGFWMADAMIDLYARYFRFPFVIRAANPGALVVSAALGLGVAALGGGRAVWQSVRLPAAEAMRPPAPASFSRGGLDRALERLALRQTSVMILRSILRWPGRAAVTLFGVSASVAVLVMSYFMFDSAQLLGDSMFGAANRQDMTLALTEPEGEEVLLAARALPGVLKVEPGYAIPARLVNGTAERLGAVQAHWDGATLARLVDDRGAAVALPPHGLVLPEKLARVLGVGPGSWLEVELLAPPRETLRLPVTAVFAQGLGQEAHIAAPALFAALRSAPQVSHLHLALDDARRAALDERLGTLPAVAGLIDWAEVERQFKALMHDNLLTMVTIYTGIGMMIAVGVIYNAAQILLSERSYELATLRVLGFSRREVAYVLVGEMMLLTLVAIPVGWLAGTWLAQGMVNAVSTDIIQLPLEISRRTYAYAAIAAAVAAFVSVQLVRRRLDRIDLVSALKSQE
ncbi:MAG: FtsX-like permease family protein [Paracoccaceae bacterium]|nr:FtsX-like permease family protein [Paracoccaceae bacterium]